MKEKRFDKLRYYNIKMKHIKIKDTRVRKNKMFQEDQGMFYRKKQETKELKERVLKRVPARNQRRQHRNPTSKMGEHSCKENRAKS